VFQALADHCAGRESSASAGHGSKVRDGANDAATLERASSDIATSDIGSHSAIETADIAVMAGGRSLT
jgi:cation transport ATPase